MGKKKPLFEIISISSVLLGGLYFAIFRLFDGNGSISPTDGILRIFLPSVFFAFVIIFFATRAYRNRKTGFISYGKAFLIGFIINMVANLIFMTFAELDRYYFRPDYIENNIQSMKEYAKTTYNFSEDQLEAEYKFYEKSRLLSYRIIEHLTSSLLFSIIIPLITSIFVWRKDKTKFSDPLVLDSEM